MLLTIAKIFCLGVSAWWLVAVVADLLYIIITHNPTAVTSFMCNPFCIISFPMLELKMHQGAIFWLGGFVLVLFTILFFL